MDSACDAGHRVDEDGHELMGECVRKMRRSSRGYSLMELLVVVAIVGIVALITVPALLQLMPQYRIRSAAGETAAAIRMIRSQAVAQRTPWRIQFDLGKNRYRYWRLATPGANMSVAGSWTPMRRNPRWQQVGTAEEWVGLSAVQISSPSTAARQAFRDVVCPVNVSPAEIDLIFLRTGAVADQGVCSVSPPSPPIVFKDDSDLDAITEDPYLKFAVDSNMVQYNRYFLTISRNGIVRVTPAKE